VQSRGSAALRESGRYTFGPLAACIAVANFRDMTLSPNSPLPPVEMRPDLRLVVKARAPGRRSYVWEIVREDPHPQPLVQRSSRSYGSMEEAYANGSVALTIVRSSSAPD
jgi:hypothetical protein